MAESGSTSPDWHAASQRIETLLEASSGGGVVARERAEELVRLVADLYGAGLERLLDIMYAQGHLDDDVLEVLADDDLVSNLLLVHDLHPYDVETRVERALESVRPYLGTHGGDVELLEVAGDVVRLKLLGSCDGCPSSAVTLKLSVEGAVEAAAPEITTIEVEEATADHVAKAAGLIPVASLRSRLLEVDSPSWTPIVDIADLAPNAVRPLEVAGTSVLICRLGDDLLAYADRCARCDESMAGSVLARRLGAAVGEAVLTCTHCRAHYDVRRAGLCLDDEFLHLTPLPLLTTDGITSVATPSAVSA